MICWLRHIYIFRFQRCNMTTINLSVQFLQNWYMLLQMFINSYLPIEEIELSYRGWNMKLYSIAFTTCFGDCLLNCCPRPIWVLDRHLALRSSRVWQWSAQSSFRSSTLDWWSWKSRPAHALGSAQWAADWTKLWWSTAYQQLTSTLNIS